MASSRPATTSPRSFSPPASASGLLELPAIASLDVAPTLAHLLGIAMAELEGRLLTEILT
jgi:hypothetical protein